MTVGAYLTFAARLRHVSASEVSARVGEAEEKTALRQAHGEVIGELSHGYRQRVGVAQAIVHRPPLLILDEPSAGLDPAQIVEMRSLLRGLRGEHTVLISSHFLTEISQTCDRLLVIHAGELVGQGSEDELAQAMGKGSASVVVEIRGKPAGIVESIATISGICKVSAGAGSSPNTTLEIAANRDVRADVARHLVGAGCDLLRLEQNERRLESIFMNLTREDGGQQ
jgi:ABC-2 type transport system ATP-binding protein